jgi:hypothetical protein
MAGGEWRVASEYGQLPVTSGQWPVASESDGREPAVIEKRQNAANLLVVLMIGML